MEIESIETLHELSRSVGPMLLLGTFSLLGRTMKAAEKVARQIGRAVDTIWKPEDDESREERYGAIAVLSTLGVFSLAGICSLVTYLI